MKIVIYVCMGLVMMFIFQALVWGEPRRGNKNQPLIAIQPGTLIFKTLESRATLSIINQGTAELKVDSITSSRGYGWSFVVSQKDTTFGWSFYGNRTDYGGWKNFKLILLPTDSARLTFASPDLCPVCKTKDERRAFIDTLYVFSNDTLHNPAKIFASGEGRPSAVAEREDGAPDGFVLLQNYPNPIWRGAETRNSSTTIHFNLPMAAQVILKIYNSFGQEVQELLAQPFAAGRHQVNWDGRDHAGKLLTSGVYFIRMTATSRVHGEIVQARKMLVLE